jgi:hypothetical protein
MKRLLAFSSVLVLVACSQTSPPELQDLSQLSSEQQKMYSECIDTSDLARDKAGKDYDKTIAATASLYEEPETTEFLRRARARRAGYVDELMVYRQQAKSKEYCYVAATSTQDKRNAWVKRNEKEWLKGYPEASPYQEDLKSKASKKSDAEWAVKKADIDAFHEAKGRGEVTGIYRDSWRSSSAASGSSQCTPGPRCASADAAAQRRIAGWQASLGSATTFISSSVAYCTNAEVVKVARVCEAEFKAKGDSVCANISARQAEQSQSAANDALNNARASAASSSLRPQC